MQINNLNVSEEVKNALANNKPVVALESTIISHGMPYPKNVETAFRQEKASDILTDLVTYCAGNKCSMRTVSEDIKSSNEISSERLTEMHVLSNEVLDYDCNTYSCMVIASNLLGNETIKDGRKVYSPLKEGVKYFYNYR